MFDDRRENIFMDIRRNNLINGIERPPEVLYIYQEGTNGTE